MTLSNSPKIKTRYTFNEIKNVDEETKEAEKGKEKHKSPDIFIAKLPSFVGRAWCADIFIVISLK